MKDVGTAQGDAVEGIPQALFDAVDRVFSDWYLARVTVITGRSDPAIDQAAGSAAEWVRTELSKLLATDAEQQRTNPLQLLRSAARFAEPVIRGMGVPVPERDEFEQRAMPEDPYGIGPLAWIDLGEDVHEAGITWGAWKAATIISRHRDG